MIIHAAEQCVRPPFKRLAVIALAAMAALSSGGLLAPQPALAWWRGGVWVGGPGPRYYGPRPYYYGPRPYYYPPVVVAPPPVYYAPPPVYAPPPIAYAPPPPVYFPPQPAPVAARTCFTPALNCPMEVPRSPGAGCYCSDSTGDRVYGSAH